MKLRGFLIAPSLCCAQTFVWDKLKGNCPADFTSPSIELSYGDQDLFPIEPTYWKPSDPNKVLVRVQGGSEFLLDHALRLSGYRGCVVYDPERRNPRHSFDAAAATLRILGKARNVYFWGTVAGSVHRFKMVVAERWAVPITRIILDDDLEQQIHSHSSQIPTAAPDTRSTSQLESDFEVQLAYEVRRQPVYVMLKSGDSRQIQPAPRGEKPKKEWLVNAMIGLAQTSSEIAAVFERLLETPVIDETLLKGQFDYVADARAVSLNDQPFELARQLGLELVEPDRPIEVLVVRRAH